jgi:integrase
MARKKKGELPSGSIRRQIYNGMKQKVDKQGNPVFDETGKPVMVRDYISVTASSTTEVNLVKAEIKAGKKNTKPADMTLYEAIDKYITSSDALLSPSTIRGYRTIQHNAFKLLMNQKLADINNEMLRDAVNAECKRTTGKNTKKPLSSKTIINEYGLISAVLNMYAPNIDRSVTLPQQEHNQHELSDPDVIYNVVKGTEIELPVLLAIWLSFTASEILGLTKSKSISSDGNYITIKEVLVKDEHNNTVVKNKGKRTTRDRTLRIPWYIKELIDQVETDRLVTISGTALSKRFDRMIKKAKLPHMTFHDLRHVNASVMTILRIPDKYAQERGGWKSDSIMKSVYQQTFSSERAAVDERIDDYLSTVLFATESDRKRQKKYSCWLILFDLEDSQENQKKFDAFCKKNHISV